MSETFIWLNQTQWTGIAAIAQGIAAGAAAVALGFAAYQIREIRRENKKGRTLAACERYDLDPILAPAVRIVREAKKSGELQKDPKKFSEDVHTIINYLDQLATGCVSDAYSDEILFDYMKHIVEWHYANLIESRLAECLGWQPYHHEAFTRLAIHWRRRSHAAPVS